MRIAATSPKSSSAGAAPLRFAGTGAALGRLATPAEAAAGGTAPSALVAGGWLSGSALARLRLDRPRSPPVTTNSTSDIPARITPDHTLGENARPLKKSPIATPNRHSTWSMPTR